MLLSKYTLIIPFPGKKYAYALINALSGSFDLATKEEGEEVLSFKKYGKLPSKEIAEYLLERGYAYSDSAEEDNLAKKKRDEFYATVSEDPTQILFAVTYNCNLACKYCFQKDMDVSGRIAAKETVDKLFAAIKELLPYELTPPFITLFGGEPLINTPEQMDLISYIIEKANEANYGLAVVTNGYHLKEYIPLLKRAKIREIQVTVDGTAEIHDQRRVKKDGSGTYARIMQGVSAAVENKLPVNFRVVLDKENLNDLVKLAEELDKKGWLDLPEHLFKTQIGRNYELFDCYKTPQHLFNQAELWESFVEKASKYPVLKKFHRAELKGLKYLVQSGELALPSFDTCPGCKKEWAFDLHGYIYPCTANVGRKEYSVGSFLDGLKLDDDHVKEWQLRDVTTIDECKKCDVALQCGGGCAVVAKNKTGKLLSPDCRPIKELYQSGFAFYHDEIMKLSEEVDENE